MHRINPKVSVILTSFNHAKYLHEAIESVLAQTFEDFELIIWDDASFDNSWEIIQGFKDPRIKAFRNDEQLRAIYGINKAISEVARGEYIAIHHSDDIWEPEKLENQVHILDRNKEIGAVFTHVLPINEEGEPFTDDKHFYFKIFDQPNRTRHEWLRHFFQNGNALCHPSVVVRKQCYVNCGLYRLGFGQLGDFDMWIRIALKYDIFVLQSKLVRFRVRDGESNTSGSRPETRSRSLYEYTLILSHYLEINSINDFVKVFPEARKFCNGEHPNLRYALAMVILEINPFFFGIQFALNLLFELLNDDISKNNILFNSKDFIKLTGEFDPLQVQHISNLNQLVIERDTQISNLNQLVIERDTQISNLNQLVIERDTQISNLNQLVIERDTQISNLNQLVIERDTQISNLNQLVIERDTQISNLNQLVIERDTQISNLNQLVIERDTQISYLDNVTDSIYRSNSWRLLSPLRYFGRQWGRLILLFQAIKVAKMKTGSLLELLRFTYSVWHKDGFSTVKSLALRQINHSPSPPRSEVKAIVESAIVGLGPRVLFVSHEASRTGAPIFLLNIARLLKHQLEINCAFLLCSGGELENEFRALGECWILGERHKVSLRDLEILSMWDIRLIYSNTATNGLVQNRLKELGCPIICHVHELGYSIEQYFGGENIKSVLATTDFFLAGSGAVANYLVDRRKIPKDRIAIAHPFIDVAENQRLIEKSAPPLELPAETIIIGACGTIGWRKGTDLFVQLARRVLEQTVRPVHFVWIGGPLSHGEYPGLKYDLVTMGIQERVSFVGAVKSHLPYFGQFDIFVLPSREDPFPLVALDAASLGLPVVCFANAGGTIELVEHDAGIVVPYLDVEHMAEAIVRLVEDDNLRMQLGEAGRTKASAHYDIRIGGCRVAGIVNKYLNLSEKE